LEGKYLLIDRYCSDQAPILERKGWILRDAAVPRVEQAPGSTENVELYPVHRDMNRLDILLGSIRAKGVVYEDAIDNSCDRLDHISPIGMVANTGRFSLTRFLFIPPLKQQRTDEQLSKWVTLVKKER
jgi:hypothetical protein